ncbi:hypothetical protein HZS_7916 [Henneguya salminicola]|nr:hypothetical protein HZS_7916 [Henneguya salminicola]
MYINRGRKWEPGSIVKKLGDRTYLTDLSGKITKRHVNQLRKKEKKFGSSNKEFNTISRTAGQGERRNSIIEASPRFPPTEDGESRDHIYMPSRQTSPDVAARFFERLRQTRLFDPQRERGGEIL